MAIIDQRLLLARRQRVNATATLDSIDLGSSGDIGPGEPLYFVVQVFEALNGADSDETYSFALQQSASRTFASGVTDVVTVAGKRGDKAGEQYAKFIPYGTKERYLRLRVTIGGTTPDGKITAYVTCEAPALRPKDTIYKGYV